MMRTYWLILRVGSIIAAFTSAGVLSGSGRPDREPPLREFDPGVRVLGVNPDGGV